MALRRNDGTPVILVNEPLLPGGRPMPTRYWLVDRRLVKAVGQLESEGGVNEAEAEVGVDELKCAHQRYRQERDSLIDSDYEGPRPHGGVAGTATGVKCLHAHYAYYLVGGDDPVGRWVQTKLVERGLAYDPTQPAL